jgi:uncharacterized protein
VAASQRYYRNLCCNIIEFCRLLRDNGVHTTPSQTLDAVRALTLVDLLDREEFRLALRTTLPGTVDELEVFDQLFDLFWDLALIDSHEIQSEEEDQGLKAQEQGELQRSLEHGSLDYSQLDGENEGEEQQDVLYSPLEHLSQKDFGEFQTEDLAEFARVLTQMARKLATRQSRRMRRSKRGSTIDLRRALRRNLKYGGEVIELERKRRKITKPRLILLCDVSRSMDEYAQFLLKFIYASQHVFSRIEAFVFGTRLTRVTDYLRTSDILSAVKELSRSVPDWSGGTRIGESLQTFNDHFAPSLLDNRTVIIILSDGLDTGDVGLLDHAIRTLQRTSRRVIWLNPLLGSPEYRPEARGMSVALPHVDAFASAHNLASLQALGRYIEL